MRTTALLIIAGLAWITWTANAVWIVTHQYTQGASQ
jgi:hypothetical protein